MMIGVLVAMFHYPNEFLEGATSSWKWAWLEILVDFVQPALLAIGMCYLPWDLRWWGTTALGTYVFHYYFSTQVGLWTLHIADVLAWDSTGLLVTVAVLGMCLMFAT